MSQARGYQHRKARAALLKNATHCHWCGVPIFKELRVGHPQKATADHIIAVVHGGPDVITNMVPSCWRCNSRRGARDPRVLRTIVAGGDVW